MQRPITRFRFVVLIFLALGSVPFGAFAQITQPPALVIQPDSIVFTETYRQKSVKTADGSENVRIERDKFSVAASVPYAGPEVGLPAATRFDLRLGGLQISHALSDDPRYNATRKKATFVDSFVRSVNGGSVTLGERITVIKWKKQKLTAIVTALTKDQSVAGWSSIGAGNLVGTTPGAVSDTLDATVQFNAAGSRFNAVAATGTFTYKQAVDESGGVLQLPSVKLQGADGAPLAILAPVRVTPGRNTNVGSVMATNSAGGVIAVTTGMLAGTTVTIPPGAVSANTTFTVSQNDAVVVPNAGTASGRVLDLGSSGQTKFPEAVRITMPFTDDSALTPVPYYIDDEGRLEVCQLTDVDHASHTVTFETFHASLYTLLYAPTATSGGHTGFRRIDDGFQILNYGNPVYNPNGECFGMAGFAQWYFERKGGLLYNRYYQDIAVGGGNTRKGQQIIATRAHTSLNRVYTSYVPAILAELALTDDQRFAHIASVLSNTGKPQIIYLDSRGLLGYIGFRGSDSHAVLAYDCSATSLLLYDPNFATAQVLNHEDFSYEGYHRIALVGDGTFQKEPFENIYQDAEAGFHQSGLARIEVDSLINGEHVADRTISVEGEVLSGQVLVDHLEVVLNGSTVFSGDIGLDGQFRIPVSLVAGDNALTFKTTGHDADNNVVENLNDQQDIFHVFYDAPKSIILATLTWGIGDVDLDLYAIDPAGDYSCYYRKVTAAGGELDYDVTRGFGPEHWTLGGDDTVRWGEDYNFRVHYYSDHDSDNEGQLAAAIAAPWTMTILLYEGTERAVTYTYHGVLAYDDGHSADGPADSGPSWANVAAVRPVQDNSPNGHAAPTVRKMANGKMLITVPVVSAAKRAGSKAAAAEDRR